MVRFDLYAGVDLANMGILDMDDVVRLLVRGKYYKRVRDSNLVGLFVL